MPRPIAPSSARMLARLAVVVAAAALVLLPPPAAPAALRTATRGATEYDENGVPIPSGVQINVAGIDSDNAVTDVATGEDAPGESVQNIDVVRLFNFAPPATPGTPAKGRAPVPPPPSTGASSKQLGAATRTCLEKGYCKVEERVYCDVGLVKEICTATNHLFTGKEKCACYCDPNAERECPTQSSKTHEWREEDCTCQCIADGDAYCKNLNAAKHMSPAPRAGGSAAGTCECVCDEREQAECEAKPADRWKWDADDCSCQCQLSEKDCSAGQVFYGSRCTCTCKDEDRSSCQADTTGKLEWIEETCTCQCKDSGARSECIARTVKQAKEAGTPSAADKLGWVWKPAPQCDCECTATEASCTEAAAGKNWIPLDSTKAGSKCGCVCREGEAERCLTKKQESGPRSLWKWTPFPDCTCECPSPGTQDACNQQSAEARKIWADKGRTLPAAQWAGQVAFDAAKCSCECDEAKRDQCHQLEAASKETPALFRGAWHWSGTGSCSCACDLDVGPGDKCTMRDARLVFDRSNADKCKCMCGPEYDDAACTAKKARQKRALAKMPHLLKAGTGIGEVSFVASECDCKCPVNKQVCDLHNAVFDPNSCSCHCDEQEKAECMAGGAKYRWHDEGCFCECLVTDADCAAMPVAGDVKKVLDTSSEDTCGCACPTGVGSDQELCEMKMNLEVTGDQFEWDEDGCVCKCVEERSCGTCSSKESNPESNCQVWSDDECRCIPIKDALCPTNVHRGCRWLFNLLSKSGEQLTSHFNEGGGDLASYPSYAVCDVIMDSAMTRSGMRAHAPKRLVERLETKYGKVLDQVFKNVGTHCRSACYNRFNNLAATKKDYGMGALSNTDVSMNDKSCHIFSRKDITCVNPKPLSDPSGDPMCEATAFRMHMEQLKTSSATKKGPDTKWKAHTSDRAARNAAAKRPCVGKTCETVYPSNKLFYEALQSGWPEQEEEARQIQVERRSGNAPPRAKRVKRTAGKKKKSSGVKPPKTKKATKTRAL